MFTPSPRVTAQDQNPTENLSQPTRVAPLQGNVASGVNPTPKATVESAQMFAPTRTPFRLRSYTQNPYHSHRRRVLRGGYIT